MNCHSTLHVRAACRLSLLALLVGAALPAHAGDDRERPVRVEPVGAGQTEASPGEIVSAAFVLTNPAAEPRTVRTDVALPEGWVALFVTPAQPLGARERVTRLVSFRIPDYAAPGRYEVRLTARSEGGAFQPGEGVLVVQVRTRSALEITALDAPTMMPAGAAYDVRFLMTNTGNARLRVRLEAQARGGAAELDVPEAVLEAGDAHVATVRVVAPGAIRRRQRHSVRLLAYVGDDEAAQARASTELIPTGAPADEAAGYPVEVTLLAAGQGGRIGPQLHVASAPSRDPRFARVDFSLRTPSAQPASSFVLRDEYRFRYAGERLAFRLGDDVYGLSPLTEAGAYGVGAAAELHTTDQTFGGYYQQSRLPGVETAQVGLHVEQAIAEAGHVGLNLLSTAGFRSGQVATVEGQFVPFRSAEVQAEAGMSTDRGRALSLRFAGGNPRLRYETRYVRSTPEYVGTFRGSALRSVALSGQPLAWLQLEGAWRDHRRSFLTSDGDPSSERAERSGRVGAKVAGRLFERRTFLSLSVRQRLLDTSTLSRATHQGEHALRLQAGFDPDRLVSLRGGVEAGRTRLGAERATMPFYRFNAQARLNVESYTASLAVEHVCGAELYAARDQRRWQVSTHVGARLGSGTRIGADAYVSTDRSRSDYRFVVTQLRVDHAFEAGHRVSARSRFSATGRGGSILPQYTFAYTVPLGLPVGSSSKRAPLAGEVFDAATGAPVEGALVHLGGAVAMTDARGAFRLPAPPSGTHYLRLDAASIGLDRTALYEMPMEVEVAEEGGGGPLMIPVVASGIVEGRVALEAGDAHLANVVVEASDGTGRHRTITDRQGRFLFTDLRPGPWRVRVVHARLPDRHYLDQEEVDVLVASGERTRVAFEVRHRQRTVEILRSGVLRAN